MASCRIALIGVGKIARDRHVPAIRGDARFALVATAEPVAGLEGVPNFPDLATLIAAGPRLDAVSICTPPGGRLALVRQAIEAGLQVMIEKPPAATLADVAAMRALATVHGATLFASWHSREAGAVARAKAWLAERDLRGFAVAWKEDIRRWHPGQDWILAAGGFGVFDPGINALSILTEILPGPISVVASRLDIPANRESPIAATLTLDCGGIGGGMALDFLHTGEQVWDIAVTTGDGTLTIGKGGSEWALDGGLGGGLDGGLDDAGQSYPNLEYPRLYARFHDLVAARQSDVDARPLEIVLQAFDSAEVRVADPFAW